MMYFLAQNHCFAYKMHFVPFCTNRTFLYENRAMCKYLIFNVINEEK